MLRLLTFACPGELRLGALVKDYVVDLARVDPALPSPMYRFIAAGENALATARAAVERVAAEYETHAADLARDGKVHSLAGIQVLAPLPHPLRNVFCVGRNYEKHGIENARAKGEEYKPLEYPEFFTKTPSTVIGPDAVLPLDESVTRRLDYEVELAVVIGRRGRDIPRERAYDYVFGYTVGNDITAREIQLRHGRQWFKGKSLDSSCPLGPVIVPHCDIGDPHRLPIRLRVNGETRQEENTQDMTFRVPEILYWLSRGMTLEPGDVILTGTPAGVGALMTPPVFLQPGDIVEAEIELIGTLRTRIVRA